MKLTFLGATQTVTGSKYLVEADDKRVMIDCGLFQGYKNLRLRNWEKIPIDPRSIDALILTHAHLDHSGYIPKLVKSGFKGPIYCSSATFDLCKILLPDSGHIQEADARRANRYGYSKHKPAAPLYSEKDARDTFDLFKTVDFERKVELPGGISFSLHNAGHILGASFIRLSSSKGTSILFSGDLGRQHDPIMKDPAKISSCDYLVVESTYGNRLHDETAPIETLARIIRETAEKGGTIVIPAFAVGRAQSLLFYINKLKSENRIFDSIPVYLDSPMAINASKLMCHHIKDHKLDPNTCRNMCDIATYTRTVEQSKAIYSENINIPKIIISASGMATGGRVLHHLKNYIGDRRNTILLAGFQANGTRGDRLAKGEQNVKIHGQNWPVKARIEILDSMSAHADYKEILSWLRDLKTPPQKTFVVHGELSASQKMSEHIEGYLNWNTTIPEHGQVELL